MLTRQRRRVLEEQSGMGLRSGKRLFTGDIYREYLTSTGGVQHCDHLTRRRQREEKEEVKRVRQDWSLTHLYNFECVPRIQGLTFDPRDGTLVVRDGCLRNQVKLYSMEGRPTAEFGSPAVYPSVWPLSHHEYGGVAVDTRRGLYLLPTRRGSLVRMEHGGAVKDRTGMRGNLCGVAYLPCVDLYIITYYDSYKDSGVFLVCPDTMTITRVIVQPGTLSTPFNVCADPDATVVVVSDCDRGTVHWYAPTGELQASYGPEVSTPGIGGPCGVVMDAAGRVLVCDTKTNSVLRVRREGDDTHCECMLGKGDLGGRPMALAIDTHNRRLAVGVGTKVNVYTWCPDEEL